MFATRVASIYECDDQRCLFQCMNQFIPLAQAPAIAIVFASVLFGGCATPEGCGGATATAKHRLV